MYRRSILGRAIATLACSLVVAATMIFIPATYAATLASYDFTGNSLAATTAGDLSATDFIDGPGMSAFFSGAGQPVPSRAVSYPTLVSASEIAAVSNEEYFEFTITPDAGFIIDLSSLTMQVNGGNVAGNQATFFVRSSLDGFSLTLGTLAPPVPSPFFHPFVVDLSAAAFQSTSGPITFRTYVYDNGSEFGSEGARIDNVVLDGTVDLAPVPLPGAMWLLGSAIAGLGFVRRK